MVVVAAGNGSRIGSPPNGDGLRDGAAAAAGTAVGALVEAGSAGLRLQASRSSRRHRRWVVRGGGLAGLASIGAGALPALRASQQLPSVGLGSPTPGQAAEHGGELGDSGRSDHALDYRASRSPLDPLRYDEVLVGVCRHLWHVGDA